MALTRTGQETNTGSGTSLIINNPGAAGDLLLAFAIITSNTTINTPADWTQLEQDNGGSAVRLAAFWRVVEDPAPANYTFTVAGADTWRVLLVAYAGADSIEGSDIVTANSSSYNAPALTTTQPDTLSVYFFGNNTTNAITTANSFFSNTTEPAVAAGETVTATPGTAGPFTGSMAGSAPGGGIHVTIIPAEEEEEGEGGGSTDGSTRRISLRGYARLLIGSRVDGHVIADLTAALGPVSWRLNDWGAAEFSLPISDQHAREEILRFGNRVLVQFDNGLEAWGGVLDTPREWTADGVIRCSVVSGESLLDWRITPKSLYFNAVSPAHIFETVVSTANNTYPSGVLLGDVGGGDTVHYPDYHYDRVLEVIQDSICRRMTTHDFEIRPMLVNQRIIFYAYLHERRGQHKPGLALIEGQNIVSMSMTEQGPIVNAWTLAGGVTSGGDGWGADRLTAYADDPDSINKYGLRERAEIQSGVVIQETLDRNAANNLARTKHPQRLFDLEVANLPPAEFGDYGIGDTLPLIAPSYGFDGTDTLVRLLEREFDPPSGLCRLVVQEELPDA